MGTTDVMITIEDATEAASRFRSKMITLFWLAGKDLRGFQTDALLELCSQIFGAPNEEREKYEFYCERIMACAREHGADEIEEIFNNSPPKQHPQSDEINEFYWNTNIPAKEILGAYRLEQSDLYNIIGPKQFDHIRCQTCGNFLLVTSRANRKLLERVPCRCFKCRMLQWQKQGFEQQDLKTMPYREYLDTEDWAEKRGHAMNRAGYSCQLCSGKGPLQVHHRTYKRRGDEMASDLIVLCETCHQTFHERLKLADGGRAD
jgi:hypothetical protein